MKAIGVSGIFLLSVMMVGCSEDSSQSEWSTFRGNIQHTGFYSGDAPIKLTELKWKFKTRGTVFSSPAVSGGLVFFGSADSCLYAVDMKTGQEKWKFKTEGSIVSSPAVSKGMVFFGSNDGCLYAVR